MIQQTIWVVPGKINTELVEALPMEALEIIADLSSNIVVMHVNRFIQTYGGGADANLSSISDKLKTAYTYTNDKEDYLKSEKVKQMAEELRNLQYEDITFLTPAEQLIEYRMLIKELEENEFASAYTSEKDSAYLRAGMEKIKEIASSYIDKNADAVTSCYRVHDIIKNNRSLFRNPPFKKNSATILRSVIYRKDDFELILSGIDFILEKKKSGAAPRSWRFL